MGHCTSPTGAQQVEVRGCSSRRWRLTSGAAGATGTGREGIAGASRCARRSHQTDASNWPRQPEGRERNVPLVGERHDRCPVHQDRDPTRFNRRQNEVTPSPAVICWSWRRCHRHGVSGYRECTELRSFLAGTCVNHFHCITWQTRCHRHPPTCTDIPGRS
jgi:hypothetical protein